MGLVFWGVNRTETVYYYPAFLGLALGCVDWRVRERPMNALNGIRCG